MLYDFSHGHVEKLAHKIAASAREAEASAEMSTCLNFYLWKPPRQSTTDRSNRAH